MGMASSRHIVGITGWSGSGKTDLVIRLIPVLTARGYQVATFKHAHHSFEIDKPGKDSYEHRKAGAVEVIVSSATRWALIHDNGPEEKPGLYELLARMSPVDIVLVEGFKDEPHAKIEVFRPTNKSEPLFNNNSTIVAIATDVKLPKSDRPVLDLQDTDAVADFILSNLEIWGSIEEIV